MDISESDWKTALIRFAIPYAKERVVVIAPGNFRLIASLSSEARRRNISIDLLPLNYFPVNRISEMRQRIMVRANDTDGFAFPPEVEKALVTILVNKISIAVNLNRVKEAELVLKTEIEKAKSNPAECAKLLITLIRLNEKVYPLEAKKDLIKVKKLISGHEYLLDEKTRNSWSVLSVND